MPESNDFQIQACYDLTATIVNGQTTSSVIDLVGTSLVGIITPAAMTGTSIKFQTSDSISGTFVTVQDGEGADFSLSITASKFIPISNLAITAGLRFIKLVSSASEGADRSIKLVTRAV